MTLSKDSREFLESLNFRGIEYVIVGAHSLAFHGRPRYTGDLDILVRATFTQPEKLIQLGRAPNRIDLLTSITGVTTEQALASKVEAELDGIPVFILSKDALIRNKRAVGRPQDIADLTMLES